MKLRRSLLSAAVAAIVIYGCSSDDEPTQPGSEILNTLTFTRQSGTEIVMGTEYAVCCAAWEPGYHDAPALKIFIGDVFGEEGGWKLFILVDEVTVDSTYVFPTGSWGTGTWTGPPLSLFFVDSGDGNELSGSELASAGTVTVTALDCGPPVRIDFSIDARVDSEVGGPYVDVAGTFSATVYSNTAPIGCDFSL